MSPHSTNTTNRPARERFRLYICENRRQPWQIMLRFAAPLQQKRQISLHLSCDTFKWHTQSLNLHVNVRVRRSSFFILPGCLITSPCPLSLKYDTPPNPHPNPLPPPSLFSQLKSTGHVCFFRNDKCCTLAVPLPTSHLSWLETFYSCQLFHLTLTQTPRKPVLVGKWASLKCLVEAVQWLQSSHLKHVNQDLVTECESSDEGAGRAIDMTQRNKTLSIKLIEAVVFLFLYDHNNDHVLHQITNELLKESFTSVSHNNKNSHMFGRSEYSISYYCIESSYIEDISIRVMDNFMNKFTFTTHKHEQSRMGCRGFPTAFYACLKRENIHNGQK